jgi:hypothetical protein
MPEEPTSSHSNDMPSEIPNEEQPVAARHGEIIDLPTRFDRFEPVIEFLVALLLAVATLATAWSGYQAARWGGVMSTNFSQAGALRTESVRLSTQAGQLIQLDVALFTNFVNAYAVDNEPLMEYYEELFRDEFKVAYDVWLALDPVNNPEAPDTPFEMPEYQVTTSVEAEELEQEASELFNAGTAANQTGDDYILNTVILASVLFLAGIYSRYKSFSIRLVIIILATILLIYGLVNIGSYPIE